MDKIDKLRNEHDELTKELRSLLDKDELTEDEEKRVEALSADDGEIRSVEKAIDRELRYSQFTTNVPEPPKPEVDDDHEDKETRSGKFKVGARREAQRKYRNLGEQVLDVIDAEKRHGNYAQALERLNFVADEMRASGMNVEAPSEGGFVVQKDFSDTILEKTHNTMLLPPKCRPITISNKSNRVGIPFIDESSRADGSRSGGVRGYWVGEAAQITSSKPALGELELKLNKLAALVYVTDELLSDAAALTSYLNSDVPKELGFKMDDAVFRGDGAGKPIGIINANCKVEVAKESGQDADTVLWENIVKMFAQLWAGSASSAEWFINQNILPELYTMTQTVGTGGVAVYLPPGGASSSPYGSLMGRPVNVIEQASTLGDAGDIVLADLDQYYWATKGGIESASSIHLKFDYDETALRWIYRCDGQPMWANSLTPYKDASTSKPVSPIVTLAERA